MTKTKETARKTTMRRMSMNFDIDFEDPVHCFIYGCLLMPQVLLWSFLGTTALINQIF